MNTKEYSTISLLSDFGYQDEFVGVVHSVIAQMAPQARIVDITHGIAPFDVRGASLCLARAVQYVSPGIIVGMVSAGDPQVRNIAVSICEGKAICIGPDNGIFAPAVALLGGTDQVVSLTNSEHWLAEEAGSFDARDILAPVAAALCNGVALEDLGEPIDAQQPDAGHA